MKLSSFNVRPLLLAVAAFAAAALGACASDNNNTASSRPAWNTTPADARWTTKDAAGDTDQYDWGPGSGKDGSWWSNW